MADPTLDRPRILETALVGVLEHASAPATTASEGEKVAFRLRESLESGQNWQDTLASLRSGQAFTQEQVVATADQFGTKRNPSTGQKERASGSVEAKNSQRVEKIGQLLGKLLKKDGGFSALSATGDYFGDGSNLSEKSVMVDWVTSVLASEPLLRAKLDGLPNDPARKAWLGQQAQNLLKDRNFVELFVRKNAHEAFPGEKANLADPVTEKQAELEDAKTAETQQRTKVSTNTTALTECTTNLDKLKWTPASLGLAPNASATEPGEKLAYYKANHSALQQELTEASTNVTQIEQELTQLKDELRRSSESGPREAARPLAAIQREVMSKKNQLDAEKAKGSSGDQALIAALEKDLTALTIENTAYAEAGGAGPKIRTEDDLTKLINDITKKGGTLETARTKVKTVQDKLTEKTALETEQTRLETEKRRLETEKNDLDAELAKRTTRVNLLQQQLYDAQKQRAGLENQLVAGAEGAVSKAVREYLDQDIDRMMQELEKEDQAYKESLTKNQTDVKAKDRAAVIDVFKGRYLEKDSGKFKKNTIKTDSDKLLTSGVEGLLSDLITDPAEKTRLLDDPDFMAQIKPEVVKIVLSRRMLAFGLKPEEMLEIRQSTLGSEAVTSGLNEVKAFIAEVNTAQETGVLKSSAGFWARYRFYFKKHPYTLGRLLIGAAMLAALAKPKAEEEVKIMAA